MRLQRKDLANEFSLIVQQEIKNHNEVVLAAHSSIEEFRRKIKEIADRSEKEVAWSSNMFAANSRDIKRLELLLAESALKFSIRLNDCNDFMKSSLNGIKKSIEDRESYFLTIDGFHEFQSKVDQWIAHLKIAFATQKNLLLDEIQAVSKLINKEIENSRQELEHKIKYCQEAYKDINKNLDVFALNADGIKREIEICKKRCFVIEKNIENIYTQMKRTNMGEK